jgi:transcriptional regulator with XRE-family HTH domain
MISGTTLKAKRVAAGISGQVLCSKAGFARSHLSAIERGYCIPTHEELIRIDALLEELIRAKTLIDRMAASLGWPMGARNDQ